MIIYTTKDRLAKMETTFDDDTVWLSKVQIIVLGKSIEGRVQFNRMMENIKYGIADMTSRVGNDKFRGDRHEKTDYGVYTSRKGR